MGKQTSRNSRNSTSSIRKGRRGNLDLGPKANFTNVGRVLEQRWAVCVHPSLPLSQEGPARPFVHKAGTWPLKSPRRNPHQSVTASRDSELSCSEPDLGGLFCLCLLIWREICPLPGEPLQSDTKDHTATDHGFPETARGSGGPCSSPVLHPGRRAWDRASIFLSWH